MPATDAPLEEWMKVFEPKSYERIGYAPEVPVYQFMLELQYARKRLAAIDAPDIDFTQETEAAPWER